MPPNSGLAPSTSYISSFAPFLSPHSVYVKMDSTWLGRLLAFRVCFWAIQQDYLLGDHLGDVVPVAFLVLPTLNLQSS